MFRMTDHRIRKQITDKQTNAGKMTENKIGRYLSAHILPGDRSASYEYIEKTF